MQFDWLNRREFIILLGGAAVAWPLAAHAQQPKNIPRLCFLSFDLDPAASQSRFDGFFQGLRDLGYVDGQTITIDYLSADGHGERFRPSLKNVCALRRTSLS
jgi:putative tryptophan/tyrosine transport system substrate-binding protein